MDQQQTDSLYNEFGRDLYKLTGSESQDAIQSMLSSDPSADNSANVQVSASDLGSGIGTATVQQATGNQASGKTGFNNTVSGYILGFDPSDGYAKFYIGSSSSYLNWTGTSLVISGSISASSIDIPDTTTANSFHVDVNGNTWWGANVASGIGSAKASITNAGTAVFKSIQVGGTTTQYTLNDSGIFSYGDGSDGALTTSGNVTLTSDKYYTNLTISTGDTLNPGGYRIFVSGVLTVNGTIARNGNAGTAGTNSSSGGVPAAGGAGGAALSDGYLKGSVAGQTGGTGSGSAGNPGVAGTNTSNSIGSNGSAGGNSGKGGGQVGGGTGGAAGTATASNVKLIANWHLATLLDVGSSGTTIKFDNSAGSGSGAGGGDGVLGAGALSESPGGGGGGGGSGSSGGIVAIYARSIVVSASGSITANGGNGGNGGNGSNGTNGVPTNHVQKGGGGGGGGGAGGNGGQVILVYNTLSNSGTISALGGTGGTKGIHGTFLDSGSDGSDGIAGTDGAAGTVRQFQLSL